MAVAAVPCFGARRLNVRPWMQAVRCSSSSPCPCTPPSPFQTGSTSDPLPDSAASPALSFFPKRGQTLELVCDSLAFKGKGVCKVSDSGFVVMCDRALPGERFLGRVSRKKGNYAEVTKLKTITPHRDLVDAPCEYASDCGGCKTQSLLYEAQVRAKEEQVHDLIVHVGKFSDKDPGFSTVLKPIVPCDVRYQYRNKMEFSFGAQRWIPEDVFDKEKDVSESGQCHALGLHAPGFFDKVLHVEKCLLQSQAANKLFKIIGEIQSYAFLLMMSTTIQDISNI